jgi:hypothetical protein
LVEHRFCKPDVSGSNPDGGFGFHVAEGVAMDHAGKHFSKTFNRFALLVILFFVSLFILFLFGFLRKNVGMVPYVPIVDVWIRGDPLLTDTPGLLTREHLEAVDHILNYYNEKHEFHGGVLYIERSLANDRDLLWNFTTKAEDYRVDKKNGVKKWSFEDDIEVPNH